MKRIYRKTLKTGARWLVAGLFFYLAILTPLSGGVTPLQRTAVSGAESGITRANGIVLVEDQEGGPARAVAEGVLVWEVAPGSRAAAAGIRVGDVILRVNGQRVRTERELNAAFQQQTLGQDTLLDFMRNGRIGYSARIQGAAPAPQPAAPVQEADIEHGAYRCSSYNVSGGGGSCRNVPPLVIEPDRTYRFSSTTGQWRIEQGKLLLSESRLWGPGEILGRDTIRFAYDYRGFRHVVTWICEGCSGRRRPDARQSSPSTGSHVGVTLTLQFSENIGGVSGFVIVPYESARQYTHNAPLPEGAVQGLAWETDRNTVQLTTNRNNKLLSGRKYVVFLSWPRETIAVAVLDLPPVVEDYVATLSASLSRR